MIIKGHNAIFEYICNYSHFADYTAKPEGYWYMLAFASSHNFSFWQTKPILLVDFKYIVMSPEMILQKESYKFFTKYSIESCYVDASYPRVIIRVFPILYDNFLYEIQGISIEIEGNRYMVRLPT